MHSHHPVQILLLASCLLGFMNRPDTLYASDTLFIDRNFERADAADYAWIYEDKEQDEKLQAILNRTFLEHTRPYLNFGFSRSVFWIKMVIRNRDDLTQEVFYQYLNHYLDYVDIYLVDDRDSLISAGAFGAQRSHAAYKSLKMNPVYDIVIPPGNIRTLYLRIQSDTPLRIPLYIYSSDSMLKSDRKQYVFFGFFYGIAGFSLVMVFCILLITRDRMYFYFLLSLTTLIVYMLAFDNLLPPWLMAARPATGLHFATAFALLVGLFYVLFAQRFFSQEKAPPGVSSVFSIIKILSVIFFTWYLIDYYSGNKIAYFFLPLLMLSLFVLTIVYWISGVKMARFFFWAFFIPLVGVVLTALANAGVISSHALEIYSMKASYMLQNVVFIIAIADRYLLMQQVFTGLLQEKVVDRTLKLEDAHDRLKFTQQQLIQSEKMASLGTLTSGVAHEINNPLNAISGGLYFLDENSKKEGKDDYFTDSKSMETAKSMIREGFENIRRIVNALMSFSSRGEAEPVRADLHEIIDDTLLFIQSRMDENIRIEKEYRYQGTLDLFPDKIHQVLLNVIDNAIFAILGKEHMKDEFIRISTWGVKGKPAGEDQAVIEICNSGPAIPDGDLPKVFDPFFTTRDPGEGTGLGLSISYSLVQDHNGTIEVHNVPDGVCFVIKLPSTQKS